jgi:hypothetical protein
MISDAEAHAEGLSFNYTAAEWDAIHAAVEKMQSMSGGKPQRFCYDSLLHAANDYVRTIDRYLPPVKEATKWKTAADVIAAAGLAIADVAAEDIVTYKFENAAAAAAESVSVIRQLDGWKYFAVRLERLARLRIRDSFPHPRQHFYLRVLLCWEEAGGIPRRARYSSDQAHFGKPYGLTIEYFEAAAGPVLGLNSPGPEAIVKIIRRYRHDQAQFAAKFRAMPDGTDDQGRSRLETIRNLEERAKRSIGRPRRGARKIG